MASANTRRLPDSVTARKLAALALMALANTGCIYGSLACDTGLSEEGVWSIKPVQEVQAGSIMCT